MRIRKTIKRRFAWLVVLAMLMGLMPSPTFAYVSDTSGHWAASHIDEMMGMGVIKGYPDGTFKPDKNITRAEFMVMVNTAFGFKDYVSKMYSDVSSSDWFYSAVNVASGAGYITGYSDGTMRPNNPITREEAATMLAKAKGLTGNEEAYMKFSDYMNITWSKSYVGAVSAAGIMSGYPDGSFGPTKSITRAESAVSIHKAMGIKGMDMSSSEMIYDKQGTYGPSEGTETIEKNVVIKVPGVTLQNMIIKGDLTIDKEVGDGDVFLKNVKVEGKTNINGGGANSIHMEDTILTTVIVDKATGDIRIVISGSTVVATVELKSGAKLEESGVTGDGFRDVTMSSDIPKDSKVTLLGEFEDVNIKALSLLVDVPKGLIKNLNVEKGATDTRITLADDVKVVKAIVDAIVKFLGKGTVEFANVNISGVTFEKLPSKTETPSGVEPPKKEDGSTGGGSSSSSSSSKLTATKLTSGLVSIKNGSIQFNYDFFVSNDKLNLTNLSDLQKAPYYLDFENSTLSLKGSKTESTAKLSEIFKTGKYTTFSSFDDMISIFNEFATQDPKSIDLPIEYKLVLKSVSQYEGKTVENGTSIIPQKYESLDDYGKGIVVLHADKYALIQKMEQEFPNGVKVATTSGAMNSIPFPIKGVDFEVTSGSAVTPSSIVWSDYNVTTTSGSGITANFSTTGSSVGLYNIQVDKTTGASIGFTVKATITNPSVPGVSIQQIFTFSIVKVDN